MNYTILQLDEKDVDNFQLLRKALWEEVGETSESTDTIKLEEAIKKYFLSHINKDLVSFGIVNDGHFVAIGSLCLFTRLPYIENLSGSEGYILNIHTLPKQRKQGYANQILDAILKYSKQNNVKDYDLILVNKEKTYT